MSVELKYQRLFEIRLAHDYYLDNFGHDILITPTPATRLLMQQARMKCKQLGHALICSFQSDRTGTQPLVALTGDQYFEFILEADLPNFTSRADMDTPTKDYAPGNLVLFENVPASASTVDTAPESITHDLVDGAVASLFTIEFAPVVPVASLDLFVFDHDGNSIPAGVDVHGAALPIPVTVQSDSNGRFRQQVDLRKRNSALYRIELRNGASVEWSKTYFVGNVGLTTPNMAGLVRINYPEVSGHLYGSTEYYQVELVRKSTFWKYIVVNRNGAMDMVANTIEVNDTAGAVSPYPGLTFSAVGAVPNPGLSFKGLETAVFLSDQAVPFFEAPKTGIELVERIGGNPKVILPDLPNPSVRNSVKQDGINEVSEIFVFV